MQPCSQVSPSHIPSAAAMRRLPRVLNKESGVVISTIDIIWVLDLSSSANRDFSPVCPSPFPASSSLFPFSRRNVSPFPSHFAVEMGCASGFASNFERSSTPRSPLRWNLLLRASASTASISTSCPEVLNRQMASSSAVNDAIAVMSICSFPRRSVYERRPPR